jgi:hypothetical protein
MEVKEAFETMNMLLKKVIRSYEDTLGTDFFVCV